MKGGSCVLLKLAEWSQRVYALAFFRKKASTRAKICRFEVITRYMYEQYCLISVDQFVCVIYAVRAFKHAWQTHNDTMRWRFVGSVKHIISFVSTTIACWFRKLLESNANINKLVVAWEPWYIAQRPKVDILWLHCGLGIEVKVSQLGWSPLETSCLKGYFNASKYDQQVIVSLIIVMICMPLHFDGNLTCERIKLWAIKPNWASTR